MNNIMLTPEQSDDYDNDEFDDVSNNSDSYMDINRSGETHEKKQSDLERIMVRL